MGLILFRGSQCNGTSVIGVLMFVTDFTYVRPMLHIKALLVQILHLVASKW